MYVKWDEEYVVQRICCVFFFFFFFFFLIYVDVAETKSFLKFNICLSFILILKQYCGRFKQNYVWN